MGERDGADPGAAPGLVGPDEKRPLWGDVLWDGADDDPWQTHEFVGYPDGKAGGQVGAAYRGGNIGMHGGEILIDGSAGVEIGMRMRRGIISIRGRVGDFAGSQMKGGSIFLFGKAGLRAGAWMSRGTIVAFEPLTLLPTFIYVCTYEPTFLRLYLKHLQELGVPIPEHSCGSLYHL